MRLGNFYKEVIKFGLLKDPRTKKEIEVDLTRVKKEYRNLKGSAKRYYDTERLKHPYSDTRILYGDPKTEVRTIFIGIDMDTPELLLAEKLREKKIRIDLVMSHHPRGIALSSLAEVMHLQKDLLTKFGIKRDISTLLLDERIGEVSRSLLSSNHTRSVAAARLLDIPYMCVHTPADNHVAHYLQSLFDKRKPKKVGDILHTLESMPEYRISMKGSCGPALIAGRKENKAGKVMVDMTGGTEGSKKVFARLSQAGICTIVGMHFSNTHYRNAKAEQINLIVAGHISSDNLGLNLLLDNIERHNRLDVISCSGFERIKRN